MKIIHVDDIYIYVKIWLSTNIVRPELNWHRSLVYNRGLDIRLYSFGTLVLWVINYASLTTVYYLNRVSYYNIWQHDIQSSFFVTIVQIFNSKMVIPPPRITCAVFVARRLHLKFSRVRTIQVCAPLSTSIENVTKINFKVSYSSKCFCTFLMVKIIKKKNNNN